MAKKSVKRSVKSVNTKKKEGGFSVAGFIIGIMALVFCWVPFFGLTLSILAVIFSAMGMKRGKTGLAIAGLILGLVAMITAIIVTLGVLAIIGIANAA